MATDTDPRKIAEGLSKAQREAIASCDVRDVTRDEYEPFRGQGLKLHCIARGWDSLELSDLSLAVRAILEGQSNE